MANENKEVVFDSQVCDVCKKVKNFNKEMIYEITPQGILHFCSEGCKENFYDKLGDE